MPIAIAVFIMYSVVLIVPKTRGGMRIIMTKILKSINGRIHPEMKIPFNRFLNSYHLESILKQLGNSPESSADFTSIKSSLAKIFGYLAIESARVLPWETDSLKLEKIILRCLFSPSLIILSDFSVGTPASSKIARS